LAGFLDFDSIKTGGNNDIYNWALSSNTVNKFSNYENI
jgi:hypothetical protein